jgi:hypothetical protein
MPVTVCLTGLMFSDKAIFTFSETAHSEGQNHSFMLLTTIQAYYIVCLLTSEYLCAIPLHKASHIKLSGVQAHIGN